MRRLKLDHPMLFRAGSYQKSLEETRNRLVKAGLKFHSITLVDFDERWKTYEIAFDNERDVTYFLLKVLPGHKWVTVND